MKLYILSQSLIPSFFLFYKPVGCYTTKLNHKTSLTHWFHRSYRCRPRDSHRHTGTCSTTLCTLLRSCTGWDHMMACSLWWSLTSEHSCTSRCQEFPRWPPTLENNQLVPCALTDLVKDLWNKSQCLTKVFLNLQKFLKEQNYNLIQKRQNMKMINNAGLCNQQLQSLSLSIAVVFLNKSFDVEIINWYYSHWLCLIRNEYSG